MSYRPISDADTPDPWDDRGAAAGSTQPSHCGRPDRDRELALARGLPRLSEDSGMETTDPGDAVVDGAVGARSCTTCAGGGMHVYLCAAHPGQGGTIRTRTTVAAQRGAGPDGPGARGGFSRPPPMRGIPDHWNIDATVFTPDRARGGPEAPPVLLPLGVSEKPPGDFSDTQRDLFVVRLATPEEAGTPPRHSL